MARPPRAVGRAPLAGRARHAPPCGAGRASRCPADAALKTVHRDDRPTGRSRLLEVLLIFIGSPFIGALFGSWVPELLQEESDGSAIGLAYAVPGFVIGGIVGVAIIVRRARRRPPTTGD